VSSIPGGARNLPVLQVHVAVGPTHLIHWALELFTLGARWPGREADHLLPFNTKLRMSGEVFTHSPYSPLWRAQGLLYFYV
jgi:hypothetical protein